MTSWLYIHLKRNKQLWLAIAVLLGCRVLQAIALGRSRVGPDALFASYVSINAVDFAAFLFIPLFCMGQMRGLRLYASPQGALFLGSRNRVTLRVVADCLSSGLLAALLLQISSFCVLASHFGVSASWGLIRPLDTILQGIVLGNAGLVSFAAMIVFHSSAFSCLLGILYGMWDFMAMNIVGGGVPSIGWSLAIAPIDADFGFLFLRAATLVSVALVLGVASWLAIDRADYLDFDKGSSKV
ncbi:MAG: hypothetical protein Q4B77_02620 [Coriobacteriaceae bacterium]|nr:hypothetical protein [Coriobacteriaceae bacterium]